ncbi:hypothetical protein K458DRAFT_471200 [Lentithecium fluviatile CBS 122367]|uniref:CST complex subunit STN1 n=1 Tax=Lentithecium fluviatile CBS 122367 TaxID=1168545 RepID=A0A6G1IC89_9PLEO|nr:hypothetical protein K458DRAFT_471200 [Lentithecium fluviatile CBS 122367]
MSTLQSTPQYRLYPAYCFRVSPTFNAWVRMTAADVQALRTEPDFQSQHIYFHLNHPIRFVRVVGVVVAIDDINLRYTVLTLDDGSGANIEVKIVRLTTDIYNPAESPSNTTIDNVNVISQPGIFEVTVDHQQVDIGTVINAKATLSEFRGAKQLELKRIRIVSTTNEEAQAWAETAVFKQATLSKPWRLTSVEHKKITKEIKLERKKAQEYERRKVEHDAKKNEQRKAREEYLAQKEAKLEVRRRKENIIMNAGALI